MFKALGRQGVVMAAISHTRTYLLGTILKYAPKQPPQWALSSTESQKYQKFCVWNTWTYNPMWLAGMKVIIRIHFWMLLITSLTSALFIREIHVIHRWEWSSLFTPSLYSFIRSFIKYPYFRTLQITEILLYHSRESSHQTQPFQFQNDERQQVDMHEKFPEL